MTSAITTGPAHSAPVFPSRLHDATNAAWLGTALGVAFAVCLLTGLYSHLLQNQPDWLTIPSRPAGLYRVTQGVHVTTGIASVPLLLAKLWVVYPKLWVWPPARDLGHAMQRASLLVLVGGAIFELSTGLANIAQWYPFGFAFTQSHYWVGWLTIGALLVHIGAHGADAMAALRRGRSDDR